MSRRFRAAAAALAAGSLLTLSACGGSDTQSAGVALDADGLYGSARAASAVPDEQLVDDSGQPFSFATSLDKPLNLVFFGFTNCQDICGMVLGTIASSLKKLPEETRDQVGVYFVTTDPARDDATAMRTYLDRYDPTFRGITARTDDPLATLTAVGRDYGIFIEKGEELPSGGYDVVHSDPVNGVDATGASTTVWLKDVRQKELTADIEVLLEKAGS